MSANSTTWTFEGKDGGIFDMLNKIDEKLSSTFNESKLGKFFDSIAAGALKFDAITAAVQRVEQMLVNVIGKPLELANQLERTGTAYKSMMGADVGEKVFNELYNLGQQTTISGDAAVKFGQQLIAANIPANQMATITRQLGDVSRATGVDFAMLGDTFTRAHEAGYVMTRQLVMIPGAMDILKSASGDTAIKLRQDMAEGKVGVQDLDNALAQLTSQGGKYYNALANDAATTAGRTQLAHQRMEDVLVHIGQVMQPAINHILDAFSGFLDKHEADIEKFTHLVGAAFNAIEPVVAGAMNIIGAAISPFISALTWITKNGPVVKEVLIDVTIAATGLAAAWAVNNAEIIVANIYTGIYNGLLIVTNGWLALVTAGQWLLNAALTANPIGIVIMAIAALVVGFIEAYKHSETFRAILSGIGEVAKVLMDVFIGLGKTIVGAFTLNPSMVMSGIKESAGAIQELINNGGFSGTFMKGYNSSIAQSHAAEAEEKTKTVMPAVKATSPAATGTKVSGKDATAQGISDVGAGGSKVRNVNITINKLVEKIEVHATTVKEGLGNIKQQVEEAFTEMVRDGELVLGNE